MARIRTVKPEFFTSEDIVALTPLARLLYIALWCEADKEGRFVWKPPTFKLRYLPGDPCDIDALCAELVKPGLIVLYGQGYAHVPAFKAHQHINPRETQSQLPDPDASPTRPPRVGTRRARDSDAQGGREGKGKEGEETRPTKRCPPDFAVTDALRQWAGAKAPGVDIERETEAFRDWTFKDPKSDWAATWRTWIRKASENRVAGKPNSDPFVGVR